MSSTDTRSDIRTGTTFKITGISTVFVLIGLANLVMGILGGYYGLTPMNVGASARTNKAFVAGIVAIVGIFFPPVGLIAGSIAVAWRGQ